LPDLLITEKSEEWVNPEEGTYNITYTVKNIGFGIANASKTGIYIDGVLSSTDDVPELELNTSYTSTVGPFTMTGVNDTIMICADDELIVDESNEDNNCLENAAEIDLVITGKSEEWVNIEDKTYNIVYTVKNIGTIASGPCDAGIYIDGVFNRTVSTKALAPDEEETKTVGPFTMSDKSDMINVCADDNSVVPESDETNNYIENLLECTGCVAEDGTVYQCGDTVTKSCTFYGDMNCTDTTKCGLVIGADNIVIDGAGYKLNGSVAITTCQGSESSPVVTHSGIINIGGYNDVVIKDIEIQNFCTGIAIGSTLLEKMTVTGCKIHDCGQTINSITHGIHVVGAYNCTITKNEIYNISGTGSGCGGGNGIFMFGGQQGDWEHGSGDHNTITCNRIYDVTKTGIFMKMGCMHNYISHNHITGCPESGINPMCMASNYNTYEYNNLSNNIGGGFSTGGSYNVLGFNTAHNNGGGGISEGNTENIVINNSACGNSYIDIGGDICYNNTCGSGCGCDWNCNNLRPVYFDFDNDGHYSNTTENCIYSNILGVGSCCNPGLFNASHAAMLNASGICWLVPGDDPNDCDPSIPDAKPDLTITEKSEEWVNLENKIYNITYTVKNIGNADANESMTSIRIDGSEVETDPVELLAPQATHTVELGPFTMSDGSDTIRVCADNESVVTESNEDNNCKENIFKFHGKPDLVISKKYEEWVASNETYSLYTITYTIKNIGTGDANESTTAILIDGTEVATDPAEALGDGESYTSTLGPFAMTGENDTIRICADNESVVDEENEDNNHIENTFDYLEIGCVAVDGTLFRCGNTVTKSCTLNGDMTCPDAGLIIGTDGITIDGNDCRMTGTTTSADCNGMGSESSPCTISGIYNPGFDNVMIMNLEIENFCTGIALAGTGMDKVCNITINNCSIHDNGFDTGNMAIHGIHASNIDGSADVPALTVTESEIYNNEGTGGACGDGGNGIFIYAGSGDKHEYCNISYNRLYGNAKAGFWTKMMLTRSEIAHNEIWGNGYGTGITDGHRGGIILRCKMSNENLIAHNDVHDNDVDGIFVGGSNNTIEYNNVTNNTDDGIDMGRSDGSLNNELYENTVCENGDKDITTFGAGSNTIGDDNTCDTTKDYDDTGTTGCTYPCGGGGVCGDVDGLLGVTTNDGRHIFMYLLYNGAEPYSIDEDTLWAADCDGLCDGITTNDGRHIFMHLLHDDPEHPEDDQYPLNCIC
jgi:parallel beta-helix repeat protein